MTEPFLVGNQEWFRQFFAEPSFGQNVFIRVLSFTQRRNSQKGSAKLLFFSEYESFLYISLGRFRTELCIRNFFFLFIWLKFRAKSYFPETKKGSSRVSRRRSFTGSVKYLFLRCTVALLNIAYYSQTHTGSGVGRTYIGRNDRHSNEAWRKGPAERTGRIDQRVLSSHLKILWNSHI